MKVAINGLGRIGRCVARAIHELQFDDIKLAAINCSAKAEFCAHFLTYDSVHGKFCNNIDFGDGWIDLGKGKISIFNQREPREIPWCEIDLVFECTGAFNRRSDAAKHIKNPAEHGSVKHVIISAPSADADITIVYGVNHKMLQSSHQIVSASSCTTNCLAPLAKVLHDGFGISCGFATTIHSYTNDQRVLDSSHKDLRRARACNLSIIPTSTGAAKSIGTVIPELAGKIAGSALRVPTPNVSLVDFKFLAQKKASKEQIVSILRDAAADNLEAVLSVCSADLVSIDFTHNSHSCIVDEGSIEVLDEGKFCRVAAWYDNEWAFAVRMLDIARLLKKD
ncbi:glyceraldehyde-3-phosphate dehydrogenase [Rickettsiales bacterium]|nr:glyceraldehyde-3-phosphate dehydrogenase [Rickettsiales bacterium]